MRELIARDLKLRYRGSVLGVAWTLLNPIAELLVLLFIFGAVLPLNIPNYAAFLYTGLLVYGWFQSSLNFSTMAIVGNRDLIRRPGVPSAILPVVTVASHFVHFLIALPVLFLLLAFHGVPLGWPVVALPLLMALQFVFILSLAYPVAAIHVWFRDTQYLLRIGLQLLFYLTPVFYESRAIPEPYLVLYEINPMVTLVEAYRDVLLHGRFPPVQPLLIVGVASAMMLAAGLILFRRTSHHFADEL
jgi:lipopolysaccharide transport system permease protein